MPVRECTECGAAFTIGSFGRSKLLPEGTEVAPAVPVSMFDESGRLSLAYRIENYKSLNDSGLEELLSELEATGDEVMVARVQAHLQLRRAGGWDISELEKNVPRVPDEVLDQSIERARTSSTPNHDAALELFEAERDRRRSGLDS